MGREREKERERERGGRKKGRGEGQRRFFFLLPTFGREARNNSFSLSRFFFFPSLWSSASILPDPVRRLERRLLVEIEHGVRAVVERVPGQSRRGRGGRGIGGTIATPRPLACCSATPGPCSPVLLLRSRRRAREEHERHEEQGWTPTPHPEKREKRSEKRVSSLSPSLSLRQPKKEKERKNEPWSSSLSSPLSDTKKKTRHLAALLFSFFEKKPLQECSAEASRRSAGACSPRPAARRRRRWRPRRAQAWARLLLRRRRRFVVPPSLPPRRARRRSGAVSRCVPLFSTQASRMHVSLAAGVLGKRRNKLSRGWNRPRKGRFFSRARSYRLRHRPFHRSPMPFFSSSLLSASLTPPLFPFSRPFDLSIPHQATHLTSPCRESPSPLRGWSPTPTGCSRRRARSGTRRPTLRAFSFGGGGARFFLCSPHERKEGTWTSILARNGGK